MHLFNKFALVCAYSRMQTALCSECAFSGLEGALPRESYAFVLRNGAASLAQVWREAKECREFPALSGVSAYCERCRAITWLSRNTDPQQALLDMQAIYFLHWFFLMRARKSFVRFLSMGRVSLRHSSKQASFICGDEASSYPSHSRPYLYPSHTRCPHCPREM